jgi:hypothetical protein
MSSIALEQLDQDVTAIDPDHATPSGRIPQLDGLVGLPTNLDVQGLVF